MKILCDEMLKGLARWLRAAGHDTELAGDGETDRQLLARAKSSQRLLLTRDRKLLEHRHADETVCLLECNGIADCARALRQQAGLDWLYRPFSRCLLCNVELDSFEERDNTPLPEDVRDGPLYQCPRCKRIYWQGGHVKRMRNKLQEWNRA
jgi:uncharacterized protein with PIN domain